MYGLVKEKKKHICHSGLGAKVTFEIPQIPLCQFRMVYEIFQR